MKNIKEKCILCKCNYIRYPSLPQELPLFDIDFKCKCGANYSYTYVNGYVNFSYCSYVLKDNKNYVFFIRTHRNNPNDLLVGCYKNDNCSYREILNKKSVCLFIKEYTVSELNVKDLYKEIKLLALK